MTQSEGNSNLLTIQELNPEKIVDVLKKLYINDNIYSSIGDSILIAINPYKNIEDKCYSPEIQREFKRLVEKNISQQRPHLYNLANEAYMEMMDKIEKKVNITVIISGESGSGKTENTRYFMSYLTSLSKTKDNDIIKKINATNPLLQAFGNAKTCQNDNSSRFGKFININYLKTGEIIGSKIECYLLEKSRVSNKQKGERNFHIFYQMILGANEEQRKKYKLKDINYYKYLECDNNCDLGDKNNFKQTCDSLKEFKFNPEEIDNIFKILSGILYFGNVEFKIVNKGKNGVISYEAQILESSYESFETACEFFWNKKERRQRRIIELFKNSKNGRISKRKKRWNLKRIIWYVI